jgi:hypothetical protein
VQFDAATIAAAIGRLKATVHPFLGVTFLACKRAELPIGSQIEVSVDDLTRGHLDEFHSFIGFSNYYFQPFKSVKSWVDNRYPSTGLQAINTQTFSDIFIHRKGTGDWGFAPDYLVALESKLRSLRYKRKPSALDLAIWLNRNTEFESEPDTEQLIALFRRQFAISDEEYFALFDPSVSSNHRSSINFRNELPNPAEYLRFFDNPPDAPVEIGGSLVSLNLSSIGPCRSLNMDMGERLTLITGDNGLGKSFLMECAWWAATGEWLHEAAFPGEERFLVGEVPEIGFTIRDSHLIARNTTIPFDWGRESWDEPKDRPRLRALGVYSAADGSFAIYDPGKERRRKSITLSQSDIWGTGSKEMEGIVRDWVRWEQSPDKFAFSLLKELMAKLSPEDLGILEPAGRTIRVPSDRRDIPMIRHSYGETPITFESDGVKRVLGLCYLIAWTIHEHRLTAKRRQEAPLDRLILVMDEVESHLHPRWQRTILPAVIEATCAISEISSLQIIAATHSPVVLSSIETLFDPALDQSYHFSIEGSDVAFGPLQYSAQGEISHWITSPFIGLRYARSKQGENALAKAKALQELDEPSPGEIAEVYELLKKALSPTDSFWARWVFFAKKHGVGL